MIGLLDVPKLLAAMALGMVVAGVPAYFQGKSHQRQAMAVEALESSVKILRDRNTIDEDVSRSDAASLCAYYGLPDDEVGECMRRVRSASSEAGNIDLHSPERSRFRQ